MTPAKQEEAERPLWVEGGDKPLSQSWFRFWPVSGDSIGVNLNPAFLCTRPGAVLFINVIINTLDLRKTRDGRNSFSL